MKRMIKCKMLLVSALALLISACDTQPMAGEQSALAKGAEVSKGEQIEVQAMSDNKVRDADQGIAIESSQSAQFAFAMDDAIQEVDPGDIPSLEERNAILDRVNRGGLVFPESEQAPVGDGPAPGTESILASGTHADDILDRVNQGGPVLPGSEETIGEGPSLGTESTFGAESSSNTMEEAGYHSLNQFIQMLRNWLRVIFE